METTVKSTSNPQVRTEKRIAQTSALFWERLEFSRFGIIALLVIVLGCVGGIAASFGATASVIGLALIAFPTIIALAFILAVAPMRIIVYASAIAIVLDLLVLIF
jgi:hypothetical protein